MKQTGHYDFPLLELHFLVVKIVGLLLQTFLPFLSFLFHIFFAP